MATPIVNRRDLSFLLDEVLAVEALTRRPRFAEHSRSTFDTVLDTAERLAQAEFAPHNRRSDQEEPRWDGRAVTIIPDVKAALDAFSAAGFMAMRADLDDGGMQLPETIVQAVMAVFMSANIATTAYAMLTQAAANLVATFAAPEQRALWLPKMLEGRVFGTMALTEPQAGSSLADIRTSAVRQADGSYLLSGSKMWISGGEHELSENIVHLVLARVPGGPPGVKGISLFIVPRKRVAADGSVGAPNGVRCIGLNHKMGWRGTVNTALNFGADAEARGELVGREHAGLACMFHLMNEARIGVGMCAAALGYAGYRHALEYARTRPQGRALGERDAASPPVPILRHADVRRMLLAQKAWVEGALALTLYCARLLDEQRTAADANTTRELGGLLDLLTPIAKSWPSEYASRRTSLQFRYSAAAATRATTR